MVTAGNNFLKIWDLNQSAKPKKKIEGVSIDLKKFIQKNFVGLRVHEDFLYILTSGGHLNIYQLKERKLKQWMDI